MYKIGGRHETEHLVELDTDNFRDVVLRSDAVWIVEFYSDKCPICNTMAPQFIEAAQKAQADYPDAHLRYGAVNSRVFGAELAAPFGVTSYPWVTSFYLGANVGHMAGMGGWESFYRWGKAKVDEVWVRGGEANSAAELPEPKRSEEDNVEHDVALATKVAAAEAAKRKAAREGARSEREKAYAAKFAALGAARASAERARLNKLVAAKKAMKPKLEQWLRQRVAILTEIAASGVEPAAAAGAGAGAAGEKKEEKEKDEL